MQYILCRNFRRHWGVEITIKWIRKSRRIALVLMNAQIALRGFLPFGTEVMSVLYLCLFWVIAFGKDSSIISGRKRSALFTKPLPRISFFWMYSSDVRFSVSNSVWAIDFILCRMASTPPRYEKCHPAGLKILSGFRKRRRVADGP